MIFDAQAFEALTAGDRDLQQELLEIFRGEQGVMIAEAKTVAAPIFSHKLRGLAANLAAPQLVEIAEGWPGDDPAEAIERLTLSMSELEAAIVSHLKGRP